MLTPFNQIKWRLTLVILGTSMVVLILGAVAVLIYDSVTSKKNLLSQVDTMAEITAANSAAALAFENVRDAQETLDSLRVRSEIDLACLYLKDGRPFVFFTTNGMTLNSVGPLVEHDWHYFDSKRLILKRGVFFGEEPIGSIVLCANLKELTARSRAFLAIALTSLIGLIGVALLLGTRLQRLVSDPIAELARVASQITAHKDYSVRVQNASTDEIGSLVVAFNQMLAEIEHQNQSLVESETRLTLALSASHMGVWEWNFQADTVSWSKESNRIFGRLAPETTLEDFVKRIHPEDAGWVMATMKRSVAERTPFLAEYRVAPAGGEALWVAHHGHVHPDSSGRAGVLAGIVQDISFRKQAEADRQRLVGRLLRAEEEERRRIARELHDTTAQHLAALKINFTRLLEDHDQKPEPKLQAEIRYLLNQALQEIRTLTYVLHPPLLEEFGLVGALRDFASGVSRRNGIQIELHADEYEGRLPANIELTLFRVVQESLTNAIRHSGTSEISIRLARDNQEARVEIQDFGHGFPADPKSLRNSGVGIASMQERLALVGGVLNVESDLEGVTVLASVPIPVATIANPVTEPNP